MYVDIAISEARLLGGAVDAALLAKAEKPMVTRYHSSTTRVKIAAKNGYAENYARN